MIAGRTPRHHRPAEAAGDACRSPYKKEKGKYDKKISDDFGDGFLICHFFIGCTTMPVSQQEEVVNYTPDSQAAPGSGGVTFTVGNVAYKAVRDINLFMYPQFENLDQAVKEDLAEIPTAKGFSVRGPFDSYDLIPYSDKKAIDLYLLPIMEPFIHCKAKKTSEHCTGDIEVKGKITLELREIITR